MKTTEETISKLNDLIEINNDRTAGFEKASESLEENDSDLRPIFSQLGAQSHNNAQALTTLIINLGGEASTGTSFTGSVHRAWLNVEALFTGKDRATILAECERGEDAIKQAYRDVLNDSEGLDYEVTSVLHEQFEDVIAAHDSIKVLRDGAKANEDQNDYNTRKQDYSEITETAPGTFETSNQSLSNEDKEWGLEFEHNSPDNNTIIAEDESDEQFEFEKPNLDHQYQTQEMQQQSNNDTAFDNDTRVKYDTKLAEFFLDELKDLLWAEQELVDTLPEMAEAATSPELKKAFTNHLSETELHVSRLEQIFNLLGEDPDTKKCEAMAGIIEEGEDIIDETEEGTSTRDVGLVFAGQKVEHYEIASYGGMVTLANTLGYTEIATLLSQTLEEEKAADSMLSQIAEHNINYAAKIESE